jgi:hypothetical protein
MNLVLKFLAALAGVDAMLVPSQAEWPVSPKVVTCAWIDADSNANQTRRLWTGENFDQSEREEVVPCRPSNGLASLSEYGAAKCVDGRTVMRDVSFHQMVIQVST